MSCGDCDWGCTMPGCGRKMAFCREHYDKLGERVEPLHAVAAAARACVEWQQKHDTYKCIHEVDNQDCRACANEPPHFPVGVDQFTALHSALIAAGFMPPLDFTKAASPSESEEGTK